MNVYEIVTDRIIKQLEQGVIPWHKPWVTLHGGAYNLVSGKTYSLLNRMLLQHSGGYATYKQIIAMGGRVKDGEKPEIVTFWKYDEEPASEDAEENDEEKKKRKPILRYYRVYHVETQTEGIEIPSGYEPLNEFENCPEAEEAFRRYLVCEGINLRQEESAEAYYSPVLDEIVLPRKEQFSDMTEYMGTCWHEAIHSTGSEKRLNRIQKRVAFGDEHYSTEELVAEIGASCLLQSFGIQTESCLKNSASYCYEWLKVLKHDKRMITVAAAQSEKACKFILERVQFEPDMCYGPEIKITA